MEGSQSDGRRGEDWLMDGGSRAQVAAVHEYQGGGAGPAWLSRKSGDNVENISEEGGVAQVYVGGSVMLAHGGRADGRTETRCDCLNSYFARAS